MLYTIRFTYMQLIDAVFCTYEYLLVTVNYVRNAVEVESDRIFMAPVCCMVKLFTPWGTRGVVLMEKQICLQQ
jgi:hypothetical protein